MNGPGEGGQPARVGVQPPGVLDVPPEHVVASSLGMGWSGIEAAEILHPEDDFAVPGLPRHILVFNLGTPMAATEQRSGRTGRLDDGGVMILPAGRVRDWHLERCGEVRHLHLYLDPVLVDGVAEAGDLNPDRVELLDGFGVRDRLLEAAASALLSELRTGGPLARVFADATATALAARLVRRWATRTPLGLGGPRRLPRAAAVRAMEFIDTNLGADLSLADIARAAGFSPFHFARLFRAATGESPHRYLLTRRIERARALIEASDDIPLAHVAREVGFAGGSHLALHFRRRFGVTPSDYREAARSR